MPICYPLVAPGHTCNQITTPLVYDESLSIAQQIACLYGKICNILQNDATKDELQKLVDDFNKDQNEQSTDLKHYTDAQIDDLDYELKKLIVQHQVGMLLWDVTEGKWDENIQTMRDLFNDVTLHAVTVDQLADSCLTVEKLAESGLNVRGLAVYSGWLFGHEITPEGVFYEEEDGTPADGSLTCAILAKGQVADGHFVAEGECGDATSCVKLTAEILANGEVEDGHMVEGDEE